MIYVNIYDPQGSAQGEALRALLLRCTSVPHRILDSML